MWHNSDSDITVNKHLNKATNICQVKPSFILQFWEEKWCVVIQWQLPWFLCDLIRPECGRGLQRVPTTQIFKPSGCCSRIYLLTVCIVPDNIWLVLSRSWPVTHFLPSDNSNSRVKFIWYPWICAIRNCKFSWFGPPNFDTLVSVMTLRIPSMLAFCPSGQSYPHTHPLLIKHDTILVPISPPQ